MRWLTFVVLPVVGGIGILTGVATTCGAASVWFAAAVAWVPMTCIGVASRVTRPRLPAGFHRLRDVERSGRLHEVLGARVAKALLRRGPLAWFNPDLHLPTAPTAASIRRLDQRMRDAEAGHVIAAIITLAAIVVDVAMGWWWIAIWTVLFDLVVNGAPVVLQRYNRTLLARRFPEFVGDGGTPDPLP